MFGYYHIIFYLVVFEYPTVTRTSDRNIKARVNDSKTLQCQFNAPTVKNVTIVVWTKDDTILNSSDHYKITTFTKPAIEDLIISELVISTITPEDQGIYTCYCYYNAKLVTSSKPIISKQQIFRVYFKRGKHFTNIIIRTIIFNLQETSFQLNMSY